MSSENYHEPLESLSEPTRDLHRAISSLMEELEAVDWYQQRVEATGDAELAAILAHNRDEEIEHAMMVLEWIRRRVPKFEANARTYLFSQGAITEVEAQAAHGGDAAPSEPSATPEPSTSGSLGIGSLRVGVTR
ncbi:ferritin-like domain-containing protein [Sandaracinus amylolyticus]|uniref:ferritin-like domain-containing protein n=1 Tax=Sandaracinus amylolyticus TaxID=927083 RepID=UPI001F15BFC4|nr:ferritin-like domain-containing protein [Sandaracinus amylolyticus]UJR81173.1 Ferritin [Sandaracinus amylolyticus]